jgi:hypothetical protein
VLIVAAWVLIGVVLVFRHELGDDFARPEAWRSLVRRVLMGSSGILALSSSIPAIGGLRRTPVLSVLSLALALGWLGLMIWRTFG